MLEPLDANGDVNGPEREIFKDRSYAQGNFYVGIDAGQIGSGDFRFTLSAVGRRVLTPTEN